MIIFNKEATSNPVLASKVQGEKAKWTYIGNGKEILSKKSVVSEEEKKENSEIAVSSKNREIEGGDIVYFKNKWTQVESLKEGKIQIKIEDKIVDIDPTECMKEIPIRILCSTSLGQSINLLDVNGRVTLNHLAGKLRKKSKATAKKSEWYYNGKLEVPEQTIEALNILPYDKIACFMLGFDMKTLKRFTRLDEGRGWYMSRSSKDAIIFIPTKAVLVFGFGMYYTREGPPSYTMGYEIFFGEESKHKDQVVVTNPGGEEKLMKVFFNASQTPINVPADTKMAIVVKYDHYEEASRLHVGMDGGNYDTIEGNEQGLFKIEDHGDSGNGTDLGSGQIPELYYCLNE